MLNVEVTVNDLNNRKAPLYIGIVGILKFNALRSFIIRFQLISALGPQLGQNTERANKFRNGHNT